MKCRIEWCLRARVRDALYCSEHLTHAWRNTLPTVEKAAPREPEWLVRMREGKLPAKELAA